MIICEKAHMYAYNLHVRSFASIALVNIFKLNAAWMKYASTTKYANMEHTLCNSLSNYIHLFIFWCRSKIQKVFYFKQYEKDILAAK